MAQDNASLLSLQHVLTAISSSDMAPTRKRDMSSAVRTVARILGRSPTEIVASPKMLGIRLKKVSASAVGISQLRWNNIKSLLRQALKLVGPVMAGCSKTPLHAAWADLLEKLKDKRSRRIRLSRLVHWLSELDILPQEVTWNTLNRFRQELLHDALLGEPQKTWTDTRRTWNLAVATVPGWPQVLYPEAPRKEVYVLPWSDFPASLKEDVDKWLTRLAGRDFTVDGPLRPARPRTLETREYQLRSFASGLVLSGVDPESLSLLSCLVTLENYKKGLNFHYERKGKRSSSAIHGMASMLKSVAKHWCSAEVCVLSKMSDVTKRLAVNQNGLTEKNRTRLRALDNPQTLQRLLELPRILQKVADDQKVPAGRRRAAAQTALAVEILLFAPIRSGNLISLQLEKHVQKVGSDYHLVIPAEEVKNKADLEFVLRGRSAELIEWYLKNHRRAPAGDLSLFPGKSGAKSQGATSYHIISSVKRYVGIEVNMHLFRHIAAKLYLDINPGHYETVRRVLGHKKMETTTNFYTGLETIGATQKFAATIDGRRAAVARGASQ